MACILGVMFLPIPLTEVQVSKNRAELANMVDCVRAVQAFHERTSRFPTHEELLQISATLPDRYGYHPEYWLDTSPRENTNGWVLSFWRGEDDARYTSWNNYYTLTEQLSWRPFWGPLWWPLVCAGVCSIVLFIIAFALRPTRAMANKQDTTAQ